MRIVYVIKIIRNSKYIFIIIIINDLTSCLPSTMDQGEIVLIRRKNVEIANLCRIMYESQRSGS